MADLALTGVFQGSTAPTFTLGADSQDGQLVAILAQAFHDTRIRLVSRRSKRSRLQSHKGSFFRSR